MRLCVFCVFCPFSSLTKDLWIYGQNTQIAKYIEGGLYPKMPMFEQLKKQVPVKSKKISKDAILGSVPSISSEVLALTNFSFFKIRNKNPCLFETPQVELL